jgi:hypothetical protein
VFLDATAAKQQSAVLAVSAVTACSGNRRYKYKHCTVMKAQQLALAISEY